MNNNQIKKKSISEKKMVDYSIQEKLQHGDSCVVKYDEEDGPAYWPAIVMDNDVEKKRIAVTWGPGKWEGSITKKIPYDRVFTLKNPRSTSISMEEVNENLLNLHKKVEEATERLSEKIDSNSSLEDLLTSSLGDDLPLLPHCD